LFAYGHPARGSGDRRDGGDDEQAHQHHADRKGQGFELSHLVSPIELV
jgi:hypothetical protein